MELTQFEQERFWNKVIVGKEDECWEWQAGRWNGYGVFRLRGKTPGAHVVSYLIDNKIDEVSKGLEVCHSCDNRSCVNPKYLFLGTYYDNWHDALNKHRIYPWIPRRILRGEDVACAKLTETQVIEIRNRHAAGEFQNHLALEFNVARVTVWALVHGLTWKHLL